MGDRILLIDGAACRRMLSVTECIDVMAEAMAALSNQQILLPLRQISPLADAAGLLVVMPGSTASPPVFGVKVLSLMPGNPHRGRAAIQGFIALFDHATGAPIAMVDGAAVTASRTAAASGLATRVLARVDARSHGIIGSGVQADTHVDAILAARPDIEETLIWGRDPARAIDLAAAAAVRTGRVVRAVVRAEDAAACDVVSTVTAAAEPVLRGHWLRPGAHVNLVGSHSPRAREADTDTIVRAELFVDSRDSALAEAGDVLIPIAEGAVTADHIRAEIGAVVTGQSKGRSDRDAITAYKSLGVFAQDLFAAWRIVENARNDREGIMADWSA